MKNLELKIEDLRMEIIELENDMELEIREYGHVYGRTFNKLANRRKKLAFLRGF